jgi:DNA polymerase III alpha subunit (gram-positive type)
MEEEVMPATVKEAAQTLLTAPDVVVFDSETTSLRGRFVQIGILALDGTVLLDTLVNPLVPISDDAQSIHGITDAMVADAPTFAQLEPQLRALLHGKDVVVYNVGFDQSILRGELIRLWAVEGANVLEVYTQADAWLNACRWHCAMHLYSEYVGDWSSYYGNFRWQRLQGATIAPLETRGQP